MKLKNKLADFYLFLVLIISVGSFILTQLIWPLFSFGWYIIGISTTILIASSYWGWKNRKYLSVNLFFFVYFVLMLMYFLVNQEDNWGVAFIALFSTIIIPVLIILNVIAIIISKIRK